MGGPGEWLAGNESAIETSNDGSRPTIRRRRHAIWRSRAQNIEYHTARAGEQLTRNRASTTEIRAGGQ